MIIIIVYDITTEMYEKMLTVYKSGWFYVSDTLDLSILRNYDLDLEEIVHELCKVDNCVRIWNFYFWWKCWIIGEATDLVQICKNEKNVRKSISAKTQVSERCSSFLSAIPWSKLSIYLTPLGNRNNQHLLTVNPPLTLFKSNRFQYNCSSKCGTSRQMHGIYTKALDLFQVRTYICNYKR